MDDKSSPDDLFQLTLGRVEAAPGPGERVSVYREVVAQLAENVAARDWEPHLGVAAISHYAQEVSNLVDDSRGLNNYADSCLNESDKFVNESSKWECGLSVEDPMIQEFISWHNSLPSGGGGGDGEDEDWNRCMKLEVNRDEDTKGKLDLKGQVGTNTEPVIASFDLCDDDLMDICDEKPRQGGSKFPFTKEIEKENNSSWVGGHGHKASVSTDGGLSRSSSIPQSAFVKKVFGARPGRGRQQPPAPEQRPDLTPAARNEFRTAGQQLALDKGKKNEAGGISSSNYGASKKQLGVNGPAMPLKSAFKPPVRSQGPEPSSRGQSGARAGHDGEAEADPRYANLDPKMVELICNEIMDCGQTVEWEDIAGLQFAKETVKEIVVYPLLRPDIFTGLRGPPKVILKFYYTQTLYTFKKCAGSAAIWTPGYRQDSDWEMYCVQVKLYLLLDIRIQPHLQVGGGGGEDGQGSVCRGKGTDKLKTKKLNDTIK